jgi:alpha-N-arabinofuranosidase
VKRGTRPRFLYQQNTLRDALVAATTLDIFNRHADKVVMANIAQTVNVLQAMILTQGERMLVTPTGRVYELYAPHQGGISVRTRVETERVTYTQGDEEGQVPVVCGSASLKGKTLFVTLTNSHAEDEATVTVNLLGGAAAAGGVARVLTGEIHAHNTFDEPETVQIEPLELAASGPSFSVTLPPASVTAAEITLS